MFVDRYNNDNDDDERFSSSNWLNEKFVNNAQKESSNASACAKNVFEK